MAVLLSNLNAETKLSHIEELLARLKGSSELLKMNPMEIELCGREYDRLTREFGGSPWLVHATGKPGWNKLSEQLLIGIWKSEPPFQQGP